jgi:hypothetical protein
MDETDKVALAHACEVHHVLQAELVLAERRYRQMLFAAKAQGLHVEAARDRLSKVKNQVNGGFRIALEAVATKGGSESSEDPRPSSYNYSKLDPNYTMLTTIL